VNIFYLLFFVVVVLLLWFSIDKEHANNEPKKREDEKREDEQDEQEQVTVQPLLETDSLSAEEKYALALGDLERERLDQGKSSQSIKKYLEAEWGLSFSEEKAKDHALYTLQQIWAKGSISLVFQNIQFEQSASIKEVIAFDSARFAELLRQVILLGFLDEEEAWGLLLLNAQRVQDSFENWVDFKEAYFRGLTLHRYSQLDDKEQELFDFDEVYLQTKEHSCVEVLWLERSVLSHFRRAEN